jgi:hypothetical protein
MDCEIAPYMSYGMSLADVSIHCLLQCHHELIASLSLRSNHNRV